MGGDNSTENLVDLTPEEHFLAHQLLVKIYPDESKLIYAANMMTMKSPNNDRSNLKWYGWLRRHYSKILSKTGKERVGDKNGSFGSVWVNDGTNNKKIQKNEIIPESWTKGRILPKKEPNKCLVCEEPLEGKNNWCQSHRPRINVSKNLPSLARTIYINNGFIDKRIDQNLPIPIGWVKGRIKGLRKQRAASDNGSTLVLQISRNGS